MAANEEIDKIEEISKVGEGGATKKIAGEPEVERVAPNPDHFQSLMQQSRNPSVQQQQQQSIAQISHADNAHKMTIFDEVRQLNQNVDQASRISRKDLAMKAEGLISQLEEIKDKLKTPNLDLKKSYHTLLQNKLTHIDENLRIALSKAGVEYKVPATQPKSNNVIDRFLGYLTDGQYQLQHLSNDLQDISSKKGELSPASMLAIQIKVGFISQELDFFSGILNKALESTKTIMNVQV